MNSSFIITIFLLLACIILSQVTDYYLSSLIEDSNTVIEGARGRRRSRGKSTRSRRKSTRSKRKKRKGRRKRRTIVIQPSQPAPTTTPPVIPVENTPNIIKKYLSDVKTAGFLNTPQIQKIYNNSISSAVDIRPITTIAEMNSYLVSLQEKINGFDTPPLSQIIYFCVSLPYAFKNFFLPDQSIPIPYNKLLATMPDIFRNSKYYTQIQMMCIQWQQCMLLFVPSTNIGDPRSELYINIMNQYISQINKNITNLLNYSNPIYMKNTVI
jgi:hypothetical protein